MMQRMTNAMLVDNSDLRHLQANDEHYLH